MKYSLTLLMAKFVTHDTKQLVLSKPEGFEFEPGQGAAIAIDQPLWRERARPFTITSLREDRVLELIIKRYPDRDGLTVALHNLKPGSGLTLGKAFGNITYQGPGVFIAAGTGITPFLAILRQLAADGTLDGHSLLFSNKSEQDLICGQELLHYLGKRCTFTFTREHELAQDGHHFGAAFLAGHIRDLKQNFYVCGPEGFVAAVNEHLLVLGVHPDRLVYEH